MQYSLDPFTCVRNPRDFCALTLCTEPRHDDYNRRSLNVQIILKKKVSTNHALLEVKQWTAKDIAW